MQLRGIKWYFELCGVLGVLKIAIYRILNAPTHLRVSPFASDQPIFLRIDTSDLCAYRDVLIFRTKQYTPTGMKFTPRTIIDVGAHIGMSTILFARTYPTAMIVAVEPQRANYEALRRNTAPYSNVRCIQAAVWTDDGEVTMRPSLAHPKGTFEVGKDGSETVRAITMDSLLKEVDISSVDFLKMDIEGAEVEVFRHCEWMHAIQILSIELHDRIVPGCSYAVHEALRGYGCETRGDVAIFSKDL